MKDYGRVEFKMDTGRIRPRNGHHFFGLPVFTGHNGLLIQRRAAGSRHYSYMSCLMQYIPGILQCTLVDDETPLFDQQTRQKAAAIDLPE